MFASFLVMLHVSPFDNGNGVVGSYLGYANVWGVRAFTRQERERDAVLDKYFADTRGCLQIFPLHDPRWRTRDSFTVSVSERIDLRIESELYRERPVNNGAWFVLDMMTTQHTLFGRLVPYIEPPIDY